MWRRSLDLQTITDIVLWLDPILRTWYRREYIEKQKSRQSASIVHKRHTYLYRE